ncbi:MAG: hypothetical protein DI585_00790 [Pseudomonas fluorescens]|nr:MAG: hypothetical protein DI585_00790 [Pseudomonas fluorescens]
MHSPDDVELISGDQVTVNLDGTRLNGRFDYHSQHRPRADPQEPIRFLLDDAGEDVVAAVISREYLIQLLKTSPA